MRLIIENSKNLENIIDLKKKKEAIYKKQSNENRNK